jgi:hypothetical protein
MKQKFTFMRLITTSFALVLALSVQAQQAKKISLQGFLKDANGKAVADGQQAITFKLYTQDAGGTAAWTEDQTINVFGGVYSTHLGKTVPLENLNWGASTYYVGVTVQGTELTPRTELTFAPYSLGSPKAQEVVCSGAVGDIKHSILNPEQFAQVNGNCWVPMDGRNLATTDKLRQIIPSMTKLPDGGGMFIRSQEFSGSTNHDPDRNFSSPIAQFQEQSFLSHTHGNTFSISGSIGYGGEHSHTTRIGGRSFNTVDNHGNGLENNQTTRDFNPRTSTDGNHNHTFTGYINGGINAEGGGETRPKNQNFWVYIRIN